MWARSLAALALGMPLAVAVVGLFALYGPGSAVDRTLPALLMFFPVWVAMCSLAFSARRGLQAWGWMGLATLVGFGLLQLAKRLAWAGFGS